MTEFIVTVVVATLIVLFIEWRVKAIVKEWHEEEAIHYGASFGEDEGFELEEQIEELNKRVKKLER